MQSIELGLIGDNIRASRSPALHRACGEICGFSVTYDLLVPADEGMSFDALLERCRDRGYRGVNVTYPYKERAFGRARPFDGSVADIGACNTVVFGSDPVGMNTDHTGFMAAYSSTFGTRRPGTVCMMGAGGVGRAIAFALDRLGADRVAVFDRERSKAVALAAALREAGAGLEIAIAESASAATEGADGYVNCTPVGMTGHPGNPLGTGMLRSGAWAFDAVYTPLRTEFLQAAEAGGLATMSGYELFLHQGVDAFRHFTGKALAVGEVRRMLAKTDN